MNRVNQPSGTIHVAVKSKYGQLIRSHSFPMRSFVRNYWLLMHNLCSMSTTSTPTMVDITGASNTASNRFNYLCNSAAGNSAYGLIVGSSATAHTYTDHALASAISHGTGAGQLTHSATSVSYVEATGNGTISRTLTNDTLAQVTINELGISALFPTTPRTYLLVRDVITPINLAPSESAVVTYSLGPPSGTRSMASLFVRNLCRTTNDLVSWRITGTRDANLQTSLTSHNMLALEGVEGSIMLGTGLTAPSFTDNDLASRIVHGTGVGQLFHAEAVAPVVTEDTGAGTYEMVFSRMFTNSSGQDITVTEAGMFMRHTNVSLATRMYDRRLLPIPVTISNGQSATFLWKFTYEF